MKINEYKKELKSKSNKDIFLEMEKTRAELARARLDLGLNKLKNPHLIKELRRKIALCLTLIYEKHSQEK